jgi:predicted RNA binding protein YcfA (HicA-like mRNA interferase family)
VPDGRKLRGLRAEAVVRALRGAGWQSSERSGKHFGLEHPDKPGVRITIPIHGGREIPVKTVYSIIRAAGLTVEEFERLW